MDKTLEIVMVAVALVVAIVIVTGILQGQANEFGDFSEQQQDGSGCAIDSSKLATYCDASGTVESGTSCSKWGGGGQPICDSSNCDDDPVPNKIC